ncbi:GNAT family N-acetyltransferase [Pseudochrobactrum kiredjianiae]|uniref:GNAT family N-acetyltransferase n=1 Tax=Pseudochrobactrum kiredjianiae TaxID=386305 RepID=A0ABW3V387_9HYPH|nr:N-acetyltransferase [Pseudochrobactrum kiredjianiae]MDM7851002.1 N-acetyltransferase [Pseudochrobactrum kiredjianiae]
MLQTDLTYTQETCVHDAEIEEINELAFGPGRFVRAAARIREGGAHDRDLSFVALHGGRIIGSIRMTPIAIGTTPALLLGPLVVRDGWKSRGIGRILMNQSMEASAQAGHRLSLLVGDAPYYNAFGFVKVDANKVIMPAPVNPERLLACVLPGAEHLSGPELHELAGRVKHLNQLSS